MGQRRNRNSRCCRGAYALLLLVGAWGIIPASIRQPVIAAKHYLQVTDEHFEQGAGKAAQKAAQQAHATGSGEPHDQRPAPAKTPILLGSALPCPTLQFRPMGDEGLEPPTSTV